MEDKDIMENLLLLEKGACDLYLHGTIEASTPEVKKVFNNSLNDSLRMQENVYTAMQNEGWYQPEKAEKTKINALKKKFSEE